MRKAVELGYSEEFAALARAYERSGGDPSALANPGVASLVVSGNRVLGLNSLPGLDMSAEELADGIKAHIAVEPGAIIAQPVHFCFGLLPEEGVQRIISHFKIGPGASVKFLAHCSFPNAVKVRHIMEAEVGKGAAMEYNEAHFHGPAGGAEVYPHARIAIAEGGSYRSEFKLIQGAVGLLEIEYDVHLEARAAAELVTKVHGKGDDRIKIKESLYLEGAQARGLVKSRIVLQERAQAEFTGEAIGAGPFSCGHIDCTEILGGTEAKAVAVPKLVVVDERAKLTHEAAIGSIDKKELETLMARGLSEEEAVEIVVRGLLR
ncbi:MAG: SufD family Fe-S cluster assembly protein [Candidatus Acetothermia bacterium]|jgi:Fe-S cluster assembly scaffold protein SufB|nr:SufD family Fe-S cluster assembly protein [Candidatus Acetothermia bacterium]MDH7505486.1 SufD family Fe-S cluster assembly protein [Candidatus Acetothermia bacterium]